MRQNHGHNAILHSTTRYRNASTSIASLTSGAAQLCSMPWKRPFLWHNPFNRLHLQGKWHATNQQSMGGGHNRRKLAGEGAKRPPPEGRSVQHCLVPTGTKQQTVWSVIQVYEAQHRSKSKSAACKARVRKVKQVKLWTILAWYLYFFVQNRKCRSSTKGTKVPPGHPPLPLSTTCLLGTKS